MSNEYRYQGNEGENVPRNVQKLVVNPGIHVLPDKLCQECHDLQEVTLPEGLIKIGDMAFSPCKSLLEIKICSTVGSIGREAFMGCVQLTKVEFEFSSAEDNWRRSFLSLLFTTKDQNPLVCEHHWQLCL